MKYLSLSKKPKAQNPITAAKMTNGSKIKKGKGMSLNWTWDDANFWANWILAGSLVVGVLATITVIVSGNIKETALRRELADAKLQADETKKAAADAMDRAANTQLEAERLKERLAWRVIDKPTSDKLVSVLSSNPGIARISFIENDPESTYMAIQLQNVFTASKWKSGLWGNTFSGTIIGGLYVPNNPASPSLVDELRTALQNAGILFSTDSPQQSTISFTGGGLHLGPPPDLGKGEILIFVGSKIPLP